MKNSNSIIFIVGPTAVGKSNVAFHLAQRLGGEILSCDSMQVYSQVDIVSDKPSQDSQDTVSHHLINVLSVEESFDVAQYYKLATETIKDILKREKVPIVCGGSGMYMMILLDGIFQKGARDDKYREELWRIAKEGSQGDQVLYDQLKEVDPQSALKIHPHDVKKVIRALEVYHSQGKPISQLQPERRGLWGEYDIRLYCLNRDRQELYQRINTRVDEMFEKGLLREIKKLNDMDLSLTAQASIGIKDLKRYLDKECSLEEAKEKMKQRTRNFAKRQLTWFRKESRLKWIDLNKEDAPEKIANGIYDDLKDNND